jgi:hypothetical protein
MKNKFLVAALLIVSSATFAQNVQLHYDFDRGHFTSTVEMFKPDNWGNTFFFIDMDYNGPDGEVTLSYWEIARELKFWDAPISAHIEYNGGLVNTFSFGNAYLAGPSYTYLAKDFSYGLTFMAMYKYITMTPTNKPHNFQLTAVWFYNMMKGKLTFSGFADFWKEDHTVSNDGFVANFQDSKYIFLSEPQLWYNATKNFSVGGEVELSSDFGGSAGFKVRPTLAAKWNF